MTRRPFDVDQVFSRLASAVASFPPAALFQLADEGHAGPWDQLVGCLLSVRTLDEVSLVAARALLARAPTPKALLALDDPALLRLIGRCTFARQKMQHLRRLAALVAEEHGGVVPMTFAGLTALPGIGPKCASLVLGIAGGRDVVAVDVHVHRVTNRWGYVRTRTAEETRLALTARLPATVRRVDVNRLLVPFGKHVCTASSPRCSSCPVGPYCRRVGVTRHR